MAQAVTIPDLGDAEAGAVLIRFLVAEGSAVRRGDPLYEIDTDKVTQEVEAEAEGVLLQVVATEGGEYAAGTTIAWIGEPGEQV
jgi:pyruvate dehydrogenase E2 component (dihydrolipoamide acetyltransferase)